MTQLTLSDVFLEQPSDEASFVNIAETALTSTRISQQSRYGLPVFVQSATTINNFNIINGPRLETNAAFFQL